MSIKNPGGTKLLEIRLAAMTRVEYMEIVEVPENLTEAQQTELVDARYQSVDGGEYVADPEYWQRANCYATKSDIPGTPTMMAFMTETGLHVERADADHALPHLLPSAVNVDAASQSKPPEPIAVPLALLDINQISKAMMAFATIRNGSDHDGRWLDASGTECEESDPGARWEEFTAEEQGSWLASAALEAQIGLTHLVTMLATAGVAVPEEVQAAL